jgi:CarboxypepD_reg-like domain/TonB-dependent Receptor Plug Domain
LPKAHKKITLNKQRSDAQPAHLIHSQHNMKRLLMICLHMWACTLFAQAEPKFTVSGTIKDAASGESLIGASVSLLERPTSGATSNEYGFYSITAPAGVYTLRVSFIGLEPFVQKLDISKASTKLDVELRDASLIQEVVVTATKRNDNIEKPLMSVDKLDMQDIKAIPMLFGERDVLKAVQLLPGVKSAGEGNAGFHVRGGGADQNLILLDEAPVYNASHLLGFFSTFNADAIKDATLYKGGMPAQYGGRLFN